MAVSKSELVERWRLHLEQRLEGLDASQAAARAGTRVDGTHRPENRGERAAVTTQAYLTQGLQHRLESLGETLRLLELMGTGPRTRVVVGAWVELELESGPIRQIAIFPGGDATTLSFDGLSVQVLSAGSPVVEGLLGLEAGDGAELRTLGEVEILAIR